MRTVLLAAAAVLAMLTPPALTPAALEYDAKVGVPHTSDNLIPGRGTERPQDGNGRAGGSFPDAPEVDMAAVPGGAVQCGSFLGLPPTPPAVAAAVPAPGGAGALQVVNCFSHGSNCASPCGDGLDVLWDVVQCKFDDDYDGVWDRYGPIDIVYSGWCCVPFGNGGWEW